MQSLVVCVCAALGCWTSASLGCCVSEVCHLLQNVRVISGVLGISVAMDYYDTVRTSLTAARNPLTGR